jgi:hypothetical protein
VHPDAQIGDLSPPFYYLPLYETQGKIYGLVLDFVDDIAKQSESLKPGTCFRRIGVVIMTAKYYWEGLPYLEKLTVTLV